MKYISDKKPVGSVAKGKQCEVSGPTASCAVSREQQQCPWPPESGSLRPGPQLLITGCRHPVGHHRLR